MNRLVDRALPMAVRFAAAVFLAVNWFFPAWNKISGGKVPASFADGFKNTFLAVFPGTAAAFWLIAALEAAAFLLAAASLVTGEFLGKGRGAFIKSAAVLSVLNFTVLMFGLHLSGQYQMVAALYQYAIGAFFLIFLLEWLDRRPEPPVETPEVS